MEEIEYGKDCAFTFKNYKAIKNIFPEIEKWKIEDEKYDKRIENIKTTEIYKNIKSNKKVYSFIESQNIEDKELLSWIDSMSLIYKVFSSDNLKKNIKNNSSLIQEYIIPYTKNNRADMIICKDNKIVILEFTFEKSRYIEKAQQCFVYKEILKQQLNNKIECYSYVFSYTNEKTANNKGESKLEEQLEDFINFLNNYLTDNNALESLINITGKSKYK